MTAIETTAPVTETAVEPTPAESAPVPTPGPVPTAEAPTVPPAKPKKAPKPAPKPIAPEAAKGAKEKAAKKPTAKATPKTEDKPAAPTPKAKATGLRKPQLRILAALAKAGKPLDRTAIAEAAPCDRAGLTEWVGSSDEATRKANDAKHFPSLITLGLVKAEAQDIDGKDVVVYAITAKGRAALEAAK